MHRYIRGLMLAAAAGVLWGCGDDPLAEGAGDNLQLVGDPTAMFITVNELERMVVELKDSQGSSVQTTFSISNVSPGISVAVDESFVPVFSPDGELLPPTSPTRARLEITAGGSAGGESFDVSAGGVTKTFTVRVMPTAIPGTFSTAAPACNETVTFTVTAPYSFAADADVTSDVWDGRTAEVSVAPDGLSVSFLPPPGSSQFTFSGVLFDFAPGLVASFDAAEAIAVGADCFTGQDDPATAPVLTLPAVGETLTFFDVGNIAVDQFYRMDVADVDASYDISVDWSNSSDIDILFLNDAFALVSPFGGATASHPEHVTFAKAPGTYYLFSDLYSGAAPDIHLWTITRTQ